MARQGEKAAHRANEQAALLEELKQLAGQLGYEVREEKLLREVGYRVRSGSCRVRQAHVILIERGLAPSAQIDLLVEELCNRPLDAVYLSPLARRLLERATLAASSSASPVTAPEQAAP